MAGSGRASANLKSGKRSTTDPLASATHSGSMPSSPITTVRTARETISSRIVLPVTRATRENRRRTTSRDARS